MDDFFWPNRRSLRFQRACATIIGGILVALTNPVFSKPDATVPKFLPGRIWIQMKPDKTDQQIDQALAAYGITVKKPIYDPKEILDGKVSQVSIYRQNAGSVLAKYRDLITPLGQEDFWIAVLSRSDVALTTGNVKVRTGYRVAFEEDRGDSVPESLKTHIASLEDRQLPRVDFSVAQDAESFFTAMGNYLEKSYQGHFQGPSRQAGNELLPPNSRRFWLNHLPRGVVVKYLTRISIDVVVLQKLDGLEVMISVDGRYIAGLDWITTPSLDGYTEPLLEKYPQQLDAFADKLRNDLRKAVHDHRLQP